MQVVGSGKSAIVAPIEQRHEQRHDPADTRPAKENVDHRNPGAVGCTAVCADERRQEVHATQPRGENTGHVHRIAGTHSQNVQATRQDEADEEHVVADEETMEKNALHGVIDHWMTTPTLCGLSSWSSPRVRTIT